MLSWQFLEHSQHTNHIFIAILIHYNSWHGSDLTIRPALSESLQCSSPPSSPPYPSLCTKSVFLLIFFLQFPSILALLWGHNGMVYIYPIDSVNSSPRIDQVATYFSMTVPRRQVQRCVIELQNIPGVKQKIFHFQLVDCVNWPNGRSMKS